MADVTICDFGCSSVDGCTGKCQPPLMVRTGKSCRWCNQGWESRDGEHWVVKSLRNPTVEVHKCAAVRPKEAS